MHTNRYSDLKIFGFQKKLESFRNGDITSPICVRIKPTNRCNHDCWWCIYAQDFRKGNPQGCYHLKTQMHNDISLQDEMPTEKLLDLIKELSGMGVRSIIFTGGGEPLLHPGIVPAMDSVIRAGMRLSIITNGQLLNESRAEILHKADWVRISMDYINEDQAKQSRGISGAAFNQIFVNLKDFCQSKPASCDCAVNFIVTQENAGDLMQIAAILRECGINNIRFSPMWCDGFLDYHAPIKDCVHSMIQAAKRKYEIESFSILDAYHILSPTKLVVRDVPRCFYMQTVPSIGADLCVYACHNKAYDKSGEIGTIANQSFRDLWFGSETKRFFESFNPIDCCRHECANHHKVNLMYQIANAQTDSFI